MYTRMLIVSLMLIAVGLPLQAAEVSIVLKSGKPTQQEFERAAVRALFRRNYKIWSVDKDVVIGKYRDTVEMAIILGDDVVVVRNLDHGGASGATIQSYLRNLQGDFTYELPEYTLKPVAGSDPAKALALVESIKPVGIASGTANSTNGDIDVTGTYRADITGKMNSPDMKRSSFEVNLVQEGDQITGTFGNGSQLWGFLEGSRIKFEVFALGGYSAKGTWEVDQQAGELKGKWNRGNWNMTRLR